MFTSPGKMLGQNGSPSNLIVALVGAGLIAPCAFFIFYGKLMLVLGLAVASIVILCIFVNPIIGVLALFALGMAGDLQHFDNFPSVSVLLIPIVALGFGAKSLAVKQRPRDQLVMSLILFIVTYCVGMCSQVDSIKDLAGPAVFAGYACGFFLVLNIVKTTKDIRMVFVAVGIGAALVSFALITQWQGIETPLSLLSRADLPLSEYQAGRGVERTLGFARDPNAAAYPCILAAPVLLALASTSKRLWARVSIVAIFGATVIGLGTTQSLSGDLGLAVGLLVYIALARSRVGYWIVPALLVFFWLAVAYIPISDFTTRFASAQTNFEGDRRIQYEVGYDLFAQHPIVGAGEDAFVTEMLGRSGLPVAPHSNLLSVLTNSGLMGFVPLLLFIIAYARFLLHHWPKLRDRTLKLYAAGAISAVLGLQAQGLFIGNMGWFSLWAMAAIPICAALAQKEDPAPDNLITHYSANRVWRNAECRSEISVL